MHYGVLEKANEDLRQSGTDGKMVRFTGNLSLPDNWSDAWVRYLCHIVHFSIYHNATQQQRERHMNTTLFTQC